MGSKRVESHLKKNSDKRYIIHIEEQRMSRKFRRLFSHAGNASKVVPYLRAGFELPVLIGTGINIPEGERVKIDNAEYIVKKGSLQKISSDYQSNEKPNYLDPKFYDREFIHLSKKQRKGKTLEEFRTLRPETNYSIAKKEKEERIAKEKIEAEEKAKTKEIESTEKTASKDAQDSEAVSNG